MNTSGALGTIHQIRDQFFYIEISLYNQIEGQKPFNVPFLYVDSINITETFQDWIVGGNIVFNTDFEIFARGADSPIDSTNKIKAPYIDRTDGRNRLHITIYPVDENEPNKFDKKYWELNYDFVVTDIRDLPVPNSQNKKRMYEFVDEKYQILKERNLEWSTAILAAKSIGKKPYELKDSESALNSNDLLKKFLSLVATNPSQTSSNSLDASGKVNVGFDNKGSIDKPNIPFDSIDTKTWNAGNTKNLIKAHGSAGSTALDDLYYILSRCVASDGSPVLLRYGRSSIDKKWNLISIKDYFTKSANLQVERLIIEDGLDPNTPYIARAFNEIASYVNNFTSGIASRIQKYKFSPMVSKDDNRITNSPLHYFNFSDGSFNIMAKNNTAQSVVDSLTDYGKDGLYDLKNSKGQILLNLNQTKTKGLMLAPVYSTSGQFIPPNASQVKMILDAIFLNQTLTFQVLGLTLRAPGCFIFIDRFGAGDKNPFDDRFLGQWLVTKVSHLFTQDTYITELVCVKVDSFSPLWPKIDSKL